MIIHTTNHEIELYEMLNVRIMIAMNKRIRVDGTYDGSPMEIAVDSVVAFVKSVDGKELPQDKIYEIVGEMSAEDFTTLSEKTNEMVAANQIAKKTEASTSTNTKKHLGA